MNKPLPSYPHSSVTNAFDAKEKQVVFVPFATSATKTDPSYHLPAFYKLWALWADNNNSFWNELAAKSRSMFPKFAHPTTGLMPDYANFDGTPNGEGGHNNFRYDAWRCMMNMGCDYAWWGECSDEITLVKRAHSFFLGKGIKNYYSNYTLDGNTDSGNDDHSPGLVACNAVAVLASNSQDAWAFVDDFWETAIPSGRYRYYDGLLYFMGFLHVSGNFRIYGPNISTPVETVEGQVATDYRLYNAGGMLVKQGNTADGIDKTGLRKGVYVLQTTDGSPTAKDSRKIVID